MSALSIRRALGLWRYETTWLLLHKLRRAIVRPGRDLLSGEVEVDETYVAGPAPGTRGHGRPRGPGPAPGYLHAAFAAKLDALPQQGTARSSVPRGRLDQSTPGRGVCTEQLDRPCLIRLDGFHLALVR